MNKSIQAMISIIGGILTFFVVVEFIDAMDTSSWSTIAITIIGTLLISVLRNGLTLLGISTNIQLVVIGAIIIGAVALDQVARAKATAER